MPTIGEAGRARRLAIRYACGVLLAATTLGGCSSQPVNLAPQPGSTTATAPATGGPTTSPTGGPTPSATATPTPMSTAAPTPAPTAIPPAGGLCNAPPAQLGTTYTDVTLIGDVPAGGGAFTNANGGTWTETKFVLATPPPTPAPTTTPTAGPTPIATPPPTRPLYVYTGTYAVTSTVAPTTGCFTLITTTDGSNFKFLAHSAIGDGFVNPPSASFFSTTVVATGSITAVTLNVSPTSGKGAGTFTLDNADTGTITLSSVSTVQSTLGRIRRPLSASR